MGMAALLSALSLGRRRPPQQRRTSPPARPKVLLSAIDAIQH
jgi:hypothetical protein